jgi:hypothetical protein
MKGVLPWLVCWAPRAFFPSLPALDSPEKNIFFPQPDTIFHSICPHRPACWVGSPAVSPVSL